MRRTSHCIRLRRPPVISMMEEPFVPDASLAEIDRRWRELCDGNPAYFDGRILQVLGVHRNGHGGATLHVAECSYRFWAVQDEEYDLGVCPVGVKGITTFGDHVLLGQRAANVAGYPNLWEFAPGGGVEPGRTLTEVVRKELSEETGLQCAGEPLAVAIIFDPTIRCWEIIFQMSAASTALEPRTQEYQELRWCDVTKLPRRLSPVAQQMVPLVREAVGGRKGMKG